MFILCFQMKDDSKLREVLDDPSLFKLWTWLKSMWC